MAGELTVLEKNAHSILSNFDGMDGENYDGMDGDNYEGEAFNGADDSFVDFTGDYYKHNLGASFPNEVRTGKMYIFSITNTNPTWEDYYISKGLDVLDPTSNYFQGQMSEGIFKSVAGNNLSGTGKPSNINRFLAFALFNPVHIVGMQVSTDKPENLAQPLELEPLSPLKRLASAHIYLGSQRNEFAVKDTLLTVKARFDINNQMSIKATIAPNSTMTFHLVVGAILNTAKALHVKRGKVKSRFAKRGKPTIGFAGEE